MEYTMCEYSCNFIVRFIIDKCNVSQYAKFNILFKEKLYNYGERDHDLVVMFDT